jgi:hypothetical protein
MIKHFISITSKLSERLFVFSILFYFLNLMTAKNLLIAIVAGIGFACLAMIAIVYESISDTEEKNNK